MQSTNSESRVPGPAFRLSSELRTRNPELRAKRGAVVDLGCGRRPVAGAFGVDRQALPGVEVLARLDGAHLPFATSSIAGVFALNVLEHLDDLPAVMAEIHRVLRPGASCMVEVPYFSSVSAFADPTHRRWFTYTTFDHFAAPALEGWQANRHTWFNQGQFVIGRRWLVFGRLHRVLGLSALANRFPTVYENFFAFWFPARALVVQLIKPQAPS
ncbi:MAG TPA: class I SAM-dependent methyltransferase [Chloroflexota bacterium]|jgi:SAM-dependent methyltransferase|nr:class I SAM-dependent methyltransferase [Chloroflexota bacterium]